MRNLNRVLLTLLCLSLMGCNGCDRMDQLLGRDSNNNSSAQGNPAPQDPPPPGEEPPIKESHFYFAPFVVSLNIGPMNVNFEGSTLRLQTSGLNNVMVQTAIIGENNQIPRIKVLPLAEGEKNHGTITITKKDGTEYKREVDYTLNGGVTGDGVTDDGVKKSEEGDVYFKNVHLNICPLCL